MIRPWAAWIAGGALCLAAGALQLVPVPRPASAPRSTNQSIESALRPPENVRATLRRACFDCHSLETRWPWYSYVAPFSWLVAREVARAREAVNFSTWAAHPGSNRGAAMGTLAAACAGIRTGRMPPAPYWLLHPESRLSGEEIHDFCSWTLAESQRLPASRRARLLIRP